MKTTVASIIVFVLCACSSPAWGVDPANPTAMVPIQGAGVCDMADMIVNDLPTNYYPDYRPTEQYNFMIRHMGQDATAVEAHYDFGDFTGFHHAPVQRAKFDEHANYTSAFQVGCNEVGTFQNSWHWEHGNIPGGGAHTFWEYLFDPYPVAFDGYSDLVMQAYAEVPWVMVWGGAVGQLGLAVNLIDQSTGKAFSFVANIYDNRWSSYTPYVWHDGWRPFMSSPLVSSQYLTMSPYSAGTSMTPWSGLRFFRIHITEQNLINAVSEVNAYCAQHSTEFSCDTPYSLDPSDYRIVRFGVGQEVITTEGQISMGSHAAFMELYRAY